MELVANQILTHATEHAATGAVVIALKGDLGAGKTTLVQSLAALLGVTETVTSPTYVVMKSYETDGHATITHLIHIDAYRIEDIDEMRVLGFENLLSKKDTIICIEWPEKITPLIPADALTVSIEILASGRAVTIS